MAQTIRLTITPELEKALQILRKSTLGTLNATELIKMAVGGFARIKSNNLDPDEMDALSSQLFYDWAKDDETLADMEYNPIAERVRLVAKEMEKAEKETGEKKMFVANITDEVEISESSNEKLLNRLDEILDTDIVLDPAQSYFSSTGLAQKSLIKLHRLGTFQPAALKEGQGFLPNEIIKELKEKLMKIFQL